MRHMTKATPENLAELREVCSGKAGDAEAEAALTWSKWESSEGYVMFYSARGADIARIIDRCGSAIREFHVAKDSRQTDDPSYGVTLHINMTVEKDGKQKRVFRGMEYAFAPIDIESGEFPGLTRDTEEE